MAETAPLRISDSGIVLRRAEDVIVYRPGRHGSPGCETPVDKALADELRVSTGDVLSDQSIESDVITGLESVNGLPLQNACNRPLPRPVRNALERTRPDRLICLAAGASDVNGRMMDLVAPFGIGCAGIIFGPHGSGRTSALRTVVNAVAANAPDVLAFILLTGARREEITDWRRRFPTAEVFVCPIQSMGAEPEETVLSAGLVLEAAQRQTELGRHVFIAIDSLTALWGAMLQTEDADAQREADTAQARIGIRDWFQRAGNFGGEGLLGSGLGGSLTVVGTVWHDEIDVEAEEEGETHPHLRLFEHILNDSNWRICLSGELAAQRLYPAIASARCSSLYDRDLLPDAELESAAAARGALASLPVIQRHQRLVDALESTRTNEEACHVLAPESSSAETVEEGDEFWSGWPTGQTTNE